MITAAKASIRLTRPATRPRSSTIGIDTRLS
jgi:hypothetical protein